MNIGYRPTVNGRERTIEINIFDFDKDIYDHTLKIQLIDQIRQEKKFDDLQELKKQLLEDKKKALQILNAWVFRQF